MTVLRPRFSTDWWQNSISLGISCKASKHDFILNSQEHNCLGFFLVLLVFLMNTRNIHAIHFSIPKQNLFSIDLLNLPFPCKTWKFSTVWNSSQLHSLVSRSCQWVLRLLQRKLPIQALLLRRRWYLWPQVSRPSSPGCLSKANSLGFLNFLNHSILRELSMPFWPIPHHLRAVSVY